MRFWLPLILLIVKFFNPLGQAVPSISSPVVTYEFGKQASFQATVIGLPTTAEVFLYIQAPGAEPAIYKMDLTNPDQASYQLDLLANPLPLFTQISGWVQSTVEGNLVKSLSTSFSIQDDRFAWQNQTSGPFQIHWVKGDLAFGQQAANTAKLALDSIQKYLTVDASQPVAIYIYPSSTDLQTALHLNLMNWVAGHANVEQGVMLVSIPADPEQQVEMERQIPHELMHIYLYRQLGPAYQQLPIWLSEGLATAAELYPNPDYQSVLEKSAQTGSLIPITALCQPFPQEASGAYLAYAQSGSFVHWLRQVFGTSAITTLTSKYKDGMGCVEGFSAALGLTLIQADKRWQQQVFGIHASQVAWKNMLPLIAIGFILLVPSLLLLAARPKSKPDRAP